MLFRGGQRDTEGALAGAVETLLGVQRVSCLFIPPSSQRQQRGPSGLSRSPPALGDILVHGAELVGLLPRTRSLKGEQTPRTQVMKVFG